MKTDWKLPKKTLRIWQIRLFLITVILCAFLCIAFSFYVLSIVLLSVSGVVSFFYMPFLAKSYVITLTDTYISVECGVFIKRIQLLPRENLVYAESVSLPLSNAMGVSAVILKAAKGFCVIPEIEKEKSDMLLSITRDEKYG